MIFVYPPGAAPPDLDAAAGLIPELTTQSELNEFEAANILWASRWASRSRTLRREFPDLHMLRELHRRMFDQTWRWAGQFRRVGTNIGIPWPHITADLRTLCDDVRYQVEHGVYDWDERAVRFHHRWYRFTLSSTAMDGMRVSPPICC